MTPTTVNSASFSDRLEALGNRFEGLKLRCGTKPANGCRFDELTTEHSEWRSTLMHYEASRCPGLDPKGQVAFLIGDTAYHLLTTAAALYLCEGIVPSLASNNLALSDYDVYWEEGGESGVYKSLEVTLLGPDCWASAPATYCSTCVLIPNEERDERLGNYLEQQYNAQSA